MTNLEKEMLNMLYAVLPYVDDNIIDNRSKKMWDLIKRAEEQFGHEKLKEGILDKLRTCQEIDNGDNFGG